MPAVSPIGRATVRRKPERASYDDEVVHAILDEGLLCHAGFVADGVPYVIPTIHARIGRTIYLHGAPASRMLRLVRAGAQVCVTVTLLDGLVLARSALHHSMNYRSAVVFGRGREVTDATEKLAALEAVVEHVCPGRWSQVRRPSTREFAQTQVVAVEIEEASAKVRGGPPVDEEADYGLDTWAGVLPLALQPGPVVDDPRLAPGLRMPPNVAAWRRPPAGSRG